MHIHKDIKHCQLEGLGEAEDQSHELPPLCIDAIDSITECNDFKYEQVDECIQYDSW